MAWAKADSKAPVEPTLEDFLKREQNWVSAYPDIAGWVSSLRGSHYELSSEYMISESQTLYRFELDETHRGDLKIGAAHFVDVIISDKAKEPVLPPAQYVEKCPTCSKPL